MSKLQIIGKQKIGEHEFTGIEGGFGENKKAMLVKDIAGIHGQPVSEINRRINDNRSRFKDEVDVIDFLNGSEPFRIIAKQNGWIGSNRTQNVYLLSERGYAKLLKILEDDKAWEIYDELVDGYFNMRERLKAENIIPSDDLQAKLLRAEAMRDNASARLKKTEIEKAKLLQELSKDTESTVNKALLQDKVVEVLTGQRLLEMPKMRQKMYTAEDIAKRHNVLSKAGKPHGTAVSQLIQMQIDLEEDESEIFAEANGNWSGSVVKYAESVINKVSDWLDENDYPSVIKGQSGKSYHVRYDMTVGVS